jgi:gluconolactonase
MNSRFLLYSILAFLAATTLAWADVLLVENGNSRCVILAPARVMETDRSLQSPTFRQREDETQRQRLRESVKDLARVLGVMSGATVEVRTDELPADDRRVPILIGQRGAQIFGAPQKTAPYKQGFRYVVSAKGIGLYGESDLASSYAVYELLDRLACRWYLPGELGEVVPEMKTISVADADMSSAPDTIFRNVWYADDAYRRRNRMGGLSLSAGHALEFYFTKEDREQHPEWKAEIGGKPDPHRLRWSSPSLADALAEKILAMHAKDPQPSYSLSPDDGATWDESKDDTAIDAGDFDPIFQKVSKTDRLMVLCNRVAAKVAAKDPDVLLGMLAYVDYTRPPVRESVHPNIVPQLAPISYSRAHPMTDDRVPGNKDLRYLVEGWGKKARMTSMYFYGWFLAEPSAPNPMITKWGTDAPIVFKNNCRFWQPETLSNFEASMHGLYLGNRLAWNTSLSPPEIVDELHTKFYGHAAKEMAAYWTFIDRAWIDTPEYSGCGFAYLRRWTPERLSEARRLLNVARDACKTPIEQARVRLADDSLALFELFMKLRRDQAEGRWASLAEEAAQWRSRVLELGERYKDNYCFTRVHWTPLTVNGLYFKQFYQQTYDDATRVAKNFDILTTPPLRTFRYQADPDSKGEAAGWAKADFADQGWKTTDVCTETWSTLGYHDYFKSMWYRTQVTLPAVPAGRRVFLWLGSFDGSVKPFVNGQPVQQVGEGKSGGEAKGYCQPVSFDITAAVKPGANTLALFCTRTDFNELGTGGLIGPAAIYAEKETKWLPATAHAVPKETAPEGEGYFSIIEGKNGKLYVGTHANGVNAWLVEFDPATKKMQVVVDCHKAIGKDLKGFASQAKIHTRNNVGASGKIYFGTKQGYPAQGEVREDYPGGYPMVYDPSTGETKVYPIPVPHHGINSITPDESRGIAYISTCSDGRPGPGENSIFLILDLATGKYRELIDTQHIYGFIVLDHLGRAYHPLLGGQIVRYDPRSDKVEKLAQTIDGQPPSAGLHLADQPRGHPLNWDISPDGKTLYCVPMSTNRLIAYDLTADGSTLAGRDLGPLVPAATDTDCRAMCAGPGGRVWASVTVSSAYPGVRLNHLVSYTPGEAAPRDDGAVSIKNPDYTPFTDNEGNLLPAHGGTFKTPDGVTTSRHVTLGICQTRAGGVYMLMLQPYTVLEVTPDQLGSSSAPPQQEELFKARPLTGENSFTLGIEGPACDAAGNLYVVNHKRTGDIARVTPDGKTEVFVELPEKSAGNGIVFDKQGMMYVADYAGHNVLRIDPKTKKIDVFAHEAEMNQPNDLAIAPDGTLYASDPNWAKGSGQLWSVERASSLAPDQSTAKITRVAAELGSTNGIEVSPDGKTLYVNESVQRNIWAFPINADGTLGEKRLLKKFDDHGFDGMRSDIDGNLYVTRYGKGTVVKLSPDGMVLKEIDVLGKSPSNLCFGGPDGRTVYVTEVEHRRIVTFRVDRPGLAWQNLQAK